MSTYTQDITHLIGKINTNLPDNDTQAITAARIRDAIGAVAYNYDLYVLKTDLDTAGYVTASALSGYATQEDLQTGMQTVHDDAYSYVVEKINEIPGVDLSAYVTKSQLSQELGSYVTKTELSNMGYITENDLPDMSTYVSQDDLQSALEPYVTESQLQQAGYATKTYVADYVTEHAPMPDLSAYVTKTELSEAGYLTSIPSEYITDTELSNVLSTASYVTQNELSIAGYITNSDLSQASYVTQQALSDMGYITSSDLPDLSAYVTKTELSEAGYLTAVPSEYITETELSNMGYVTQTDLSAMSYATTSDLTNKQDTLVSGTNIKTINNTSLLGSGNIDIQAGGPTDYSHVLTFTATQNNSTINLRRVGNDTASLTDAVLQYSTDGGETWADYTLNTTMTLAAVGDSIMFKGTNERLGATASNYHQFSMSGKIKASGDVTSLLNGEGGDWALKRYDFGYLFFGCTALTKAPELPSTKLGTSCYMSMFSGCTSLTEAPELPAKTLMTSCYQSMFSGCTALTKAPELPATTMETSCYNTMFSGCTSLRQAPELPATTLAKYCYTSMFQNCTSLINAPVLPAINLIQYCYQSMFNGCSNLNYVKAMFTYTPSNTYTADWLKGVSTYGTFVKSNNATWTNTGTNAVPILWTVYKTVDIDTDDLPESYIEDNGKTIQVVNGRWAKVTGGGDMSAYVTKTELSAMGYITSSDLPDMSSYATLTYLETYYATNTALGNKQDTLVSGTNIKTINNESLLGSGNIDIQAGGGGTPDYSHVLTFTAEQANSSVTLNRVGTGTTLTDAVLMYSIDNGANWTNYTLSTTITLAAVGDSVMFKGTNTTMGINNSNYHKFVMTGKIKASGDVTSLFNETGGDMTMPSYGCVNMFYECASLTTTPELPSTTLAKACYYQMFYHCTSLTKAPELPATTLTNQCYFSMFSGCTSLTKAPELPATTLIYGCYNNMFQGCTSLTTAPELPATTMQSACYAGMFQGCTSLTTAPELPATTLAISCYYDMFNTCTSLTTAPDLPATTLVNGCYSRMFLGCRNLKYVKAMFTTTPSNTYTQDWLKNVSETGTFVKSSSATWTTTGANAVPTGWTVYKTVAIDTDDFPESYVEDNGKGLQVVNGAWQKVSGLLTSANLIYDSATNTLTINV